MSPEIYNKINLRTPNWNGAGGQSETRKEDVLLATQGIDFYINAYMDYVYSNDQQVKKSIKLGLIYELSQRQEVMDFYSKSKKHKGKIKILLDLAVEELNPCSRKSTAIYKAQQLGVNVSTWHRTYQWLYRLILSIPAGWETEWLSHVSRKLRH